MDGLKSDRISRSSNTKGADMKKQKNKNSFGPGSNQRPHGINGLQLQPCTLPTELPKVLSKCVLLEFIYRYLFLPQPHSSSGTLFTLPGLDPARHYYLQHTSASNLDAYLSLTNGLSFFIMEDDLLLIVLTIIKLVCPGSVSLSCGVFLDWSVLIAAYRLAALVSAAVT